MSNTQDSQATTDPRLRGADVGNTTGISSTSAETTTSVTSPRGASGLRQLGGRDNAHDVYEGSNTANDKRAEDNISAAHKGGHPLSDLERDGLGNKSTSGMGTNAGMGTIDNHQGIGEGTHIHHHHHDGAGFSAGTSKAPATDTSMASRSSPLHVNDTNPTAMDGNSNTPSESKPWKDKDIAPLKGGFGDDVTPDMAGTDTDIRTSASTRGEAPGTGTGTDISEPTSVQSKMTPREASAGLSPDGAPRTGTGMGPGQAMGATRPGYVNATASGSGQKSGGVDERETRQSADTTGKAMSDVGKDTKLGEHETHHGKPSMKDKIIGKTEKIAGKLTANAGMVNRGEERLAGTYEAAKN